MNKKLIIWIPGFLDRYNHEHIKEKIPILKDYEIKELKILDYDIDHEQPYSNNNFLNYITEINKILENMNLNFDKYKEIILYGHSTGGLLAILYLKYGKYNYIFNGLILNDPFISYNISKIRLYILCNMYLLNYLPFIGNTKIINKRIINYFYKNNKNLYREHLNNLPYVKKKFNLNITDLYLNFIVNTKTIQEYLFENEKYLNDFPILLLIANGSSKFINKFYSKNGSLLDKEDTSKIKNISSNVDLLYVNNTYHDIFFPDDLIDENFDILDKKISEFVNTKFFKNKKYKIEEKDIEILNIKILEKSNLYFQNEINLKIFYLLLIIYLIILNKSKKIFKNR